MTVDLRKYVKAEGDGLSFEPKYSWSSGTSDSMFTMPTQGSKAVDSAVSGEPTQREIVLTRNGDGTYDMHFLKKDASSPLVPDEERYGIGRASNLGNYVGGLIAEEQPLVVRAIRTVGSDIFVVYREGPKTKPHEVDDKTKEKLRRLARKDSDVSEGQFHRRRSPPWTDFKL